MSNLLQQAIFYDEYNSALFFKGIHFIKDKEQFCLNARKFMTQKEILEFKNITGFDVITGEVKESSREKEFNEMRESAQKISKHLTKMSDDEAAQKQLDLFRKGNDFSHFYTYEGEFYKLNSDLIIKVPVYGATIPARMPIYTNGYKVEGHTGHLDFYSDDSVGRFFPLYKNILEILENQLTEKETQLILNFIKEKC